MKIRSRRRSPAIFRSARQPFSAVVPTPDTTGRFDLMGFPAGEEGCASDLRSRHHCQPRVYYLYIFVRKLVDRNISLKILGTIFVVSQSPVSDMSYYSHNPAAPQSAIV
jgi:hypothetical protein